MRWFRFYDEALNDPKVQQLPDASFKYWVNLLCLANQGKPRGRFKRSDVAYALRITEERAKKMLAFFTERGLFDEDGEYLIPHGWDSRQFQSDNITERVQKHRRNVSRNVSSALPGTPPEADTETDTEQNPPNPPGGRASDLYFDEFWKLVVRKEPSRAKAYESWVKVTTRRENPANPQDIIAGLMRWLPVWKAQADPSKVPHITTWLNQERWTVENPAVPSNGQPPKPEDRRPAIPSIEQVLEPPKALSPEKLAELRAWRERRA